MEAVQDLGEVGEAAPELGRRDRAILDRQVHRGADLAVVDVVLEPDELRLPLDHRARPEERVDVATGGRENLGGLEPHELSASGKRLKVWDLEAGAELASLPLAGTVYSVAAHPARAVAVCGGGAGAVMAVELEGIEQGPLIVTAIDRGASPMLRCPACLTEHTLDDASLGQIIDCPNHCGTRLRVNVFVARPIQPRSTTP